MAIRRLYTAPDRVMVLRKYFSGTSIRKVSRDTNIPKSTIHDWIKKIVSHSPRSREKRRLKHYVGRYNDVVPWIANRLNENPFETLSSLQHALHSKEGVSVSVSTIQRLIRKSGYSYQTVSWRAPSRNVQDELRGFFDAYNAFLSQGYDIVALDETGFVSTKYQRKGYGIRGKCLRVSKQQHGKRQKVSSIVAIATNGLIIVLFSYAMA